MRSICNGPIFLHHHSIKTLIGCISPSRDTCSFTSYNPNTGLETIKCFMRVMALSCFAYQCHATSFCIILTQRCSFIRQFRNKLTKVCNHSEESLKFLFVCRIRHPNDTLYMFIGGFKTFWHWSHDQESVNNSQKTLIFLDWDEDQPHDTVWIFFETLIMLLMIFSPNQNVVGCNFNTIQITKLINHGSLPYLWCRRNPEVHDKITKSAKGCINCNKFWSMLTQFYFPIPTRSIDPWKSLRLRHSRCDVFESSHGVVLTSDSLIQIFRINADSNVSIWFIHNSHRVNPLSWLFDRRDHTQFHHALKLIIHSITFPVKYRFFAGLVPIHTLVPVLCRTYAFSTYQDHLRNQSYFQPIFLHEDS